MAGKFGVFNPFIKWKKGDLPSNPTVSIILNEYGTSDEGVISISATLVTDSEIDYAINELQKNLESVRKEAKRVLKLQKEKIRNLGVSSNIQTSHLKLRTWQDHTAR